MRFQRNLGRRGVLGFHPCLRVLAASGLVSAAAEAYVASCWGWEKELLLASVQAFDGGDNDAELTYSGCWPWLCEASCCPA